MSTILNIKDLKTYFYSEDKVIPAVDGVDLSIEQGKTLGVVGESGCGKSVTSLSVMRLIKTPGRIINGSIELEGRNLLELTEKEMRAVRGKDISMVFQEPMTSLNPVFTVGNQLMETLLTHRDISRKEAWDISVETIETVSIPRAKEIMKTYPFSLSGGMKQRIMIAMALICQPKILIADEPTTALDVTIQAQILELMKKLQRERNTSILLITHDLGVIAEMADSVAVMYTGKVVEDGTAEDIFDRPKHPYTIGLHASTTKIEVETDRLVSIPGSVPNLANKIDGCSFKARCEHATDRCYHEEPPRFDLGGGHHVACWLYENQGGGATDE